MTVTGLNVRDSIERCRVMDYTPSAACDAGDVQEIGGLLCLISDDVSATEAAASKLISALYDIPMLQMNAAKTAAWTAGVPLYWDDDNEEVSDNAAVGPFCGVALEAKVATTQTDALMHWMGAGLAAGAPLEGSIIEDGVWEEDFLLQAIADRPEWAVLAVNDATCEIEADLNGGWLDCDIAATGEAEDAGGYLEDQLLFDIDTLKTVTYRLNVVTPGTGVAVVWGMAGAHNLDKDAIAQHAWFRLQASLALLVETDDGTNDNDDAATGVTLVTATNYWFKIDFSDTANIRFFYKADTAATWTELTSTAAAAAGITTFDMSNYTAGLQPYFMCDKASGTGTASLHVDLVRVRFSRK